MYLLYVFTISRNIFFAKLSISKTWWNFENSKCNFKLDLISLCKTGGDSRCRLKMKVQPIYLRADEEPNSTGRGQKMEKNFYVEVTIMYFHKFSVYIDTQRRRYRVANSARWFLKTKEAAESKPFFDHEGVIFSTPFTKLKIRRSFWGAEQV